jgi:hypothetical protein
MSGMYRTSFSEYFHLRLVESVAAEPADMEG